MITLNNIAFKHPTAQLYGKINVEEASSFWPNCVIRCENHSVEIGKYTNIQDFVMIHVGMKTPVKIGNYTSICHRAVIHGATVGDHCLIGVGAIIMDGSIIGNNCIVDAGVTLKENTIIPDNSIVSGNPYTIKERNNYVSNKLIAMMYYENALAYSKEEYRAWDQPEVKAKGLEYMRQFSRELKDL